MLSLEKRRLEYDLTQTFRIIHGLDSVNRDTWFQLVGNNPNRHTRHTADPLNIIKVASRSEIRKNFFSQRVIDHWNNLSHETKRAKNTIIFKKIVHSKLLGSS